MQMQPTNCKQTTNHDQRAVNPCKQVAKHCKQTVNLRKHAGLSLVELIISISIIAIIATFVNKIILPPIQITTDTLQRSALTDIATNTAMYIDRELSQSLPNSVRIKQSGNRLAIEFIPIVAGLRYRIAGNQRSEFLDFTEANSSFKSASNFSTTLINNASQYRVVIYNIGAYSINTDSPVAGANVYALLSSDGSDNVIPNNAHLVTGASNFLSLSNSGSEGEVSFLQPHIFSFSSPKQRAYLVNKPVSYVCDLDTKTLTKFYNYPISQVQGLLANTPPFNSGGSALLADNIADCGFQYLASNSSAKNNLVTIRLSYASQGNNITLIQQTYINNVQ